VRTCRKLIKKKITFNLFYLHFWFEILASEFVELCLGMVISKTSSSYAHIILVPHFTKNFSLHTTGSTHETLFLHHHNHLDRPTPVGCCCSLQTCSIVSSSRGWIKNLFMKFPYSVKERLNCHIIRVSSLVTWFVNFGAKTFVFVCEGQRGVSTVKWMVFGPVVPDPLWKISSSEALEENELLDTWPLDIGWSGYRCEISGSSSKPPLSSELLLLRASVS